MKDIFELSKDIIDQIIFAMEDQEEEFVIDRRRGEIIPKRKLVDVSGYEDRYLDVPEWRPIDGYRLMERFASGLRNPLYRERLLDALSSGKKVFRNFKNILKENPAIEKKWFVFKTQEIKKIVYDWYNQQRELLGLNPVEPIEESETEDLVLSDFEFTVWEGEGFNTFKSVYLDAIKEVFSGKPIPEDRKIRELMDKSIIIVCYAPSDEVVGFINGVVENKIVDIDIIYVVKAYRGIGIGKELLAKFVEEIKKTEIEQIFVNLSYNFLSFTSFFERYGFSNFSVKMRLEF